ncbi:MAG: hypothetical protein JW995_08250 [Melioribacteraceae bacterium]|nr:hypothetical protein [Melioribacteraceae bacterium]
MSKLKYSIVTVLVLIATSCSTDDGSSAIVDPGADSKGTFFAEIDGVQFSAHKVKAYRQSNFKVIEGIQSFDNPASGLNEIAVKILIRNLNEPRIYAIGEDGNGFIYNAKATIDYISNSYNDTLTYYGIFLENLSLIDVTEITDDIITGTVSFRATDKNITDEKLIDLIDGRFSITF